MENIPVKSTGDTLTANEWNNVPGEIENIITSAGITLSGADLFQLAKAVSIYAAGGDYYIDGGSANTYVLSPVGSKKNPIVYFNGMRIRFIPANSNTGASTVNVASLGVKNIKEHNGNDPVAGDIIAGEEIEMTYNGTNFVLKSSAKIMSALDLLPKISGMLVENDAGDTAHDIKVNPGTWVDSTGTRIFRSNTAMIKQIDAVWAAGTNQGGFPSGLTGGVPQNNTWYHYHVVGNPSTGAVDFGYDSDINASNLLADTTGYTFHQVIWSVKTDGSANILPFLMTISQNGIKRICYWKNMLASYTVVGSGTSRVDVTIDTPPNINSTAIISFHLSSGSSVNALITNPDTNDQSPSSTISNFHKGTEVGTLAVQYDVLTDSSSQISYRASVSSNINIGTLGWIE